MATPSEETKKSASRMTLGGVGKSLLSGAKKTGSIIKKLFSKNPTSELIDKTNQTPAEVLGEIYKMMKIMDEDKKLNHEMVNSHLESEELKKEERNKEIIKALTGRKGKKPKVKPLRDEKGRFKKVEDTPAPRTGGQPTTPTTQPPAPRTGGQPTTQPPPQTTAQVPRTNTQTPVQTPKTTTQPTVKQPPAKVPAQPAAKPPPVQPPVVSTSPIIPSVVAGTAAVIATGIGAAESGGNYNVTFGDRNEGGNLINKTAMTPEQWSQKTFGQRKKLSEMSIDEVQQFQKYKNSVKKGSGAVGKYQFMPTVLEELIKGEKDIKPTDIFNGDMQERLYKKYSAGNIKTLKNLGLKDEQLTPGILYMAHYIGPGGAKAVLEMREKGINTTVAAAIKVKYPKTDVAKLLANNSELGKLHVDEFEGILAARIKGTPAPHSANQTGEKINQDSVQIKNGKEQLNVQDQKVLDNNTTVINQQQNTTPSNIVKDDDRPEWYKKLFTPRFKD
jgi:hypothetical protein